MLVLMYQTTWHHIPGEHNLNDHKNSNKFQPSKLNSIFTNSISKSGVYNALELLKQWIQEENRIKTTSNGTTFTPNFLKFANSSKGNQKGKQIKHAAWLDFFFRNWTPKSVLKNWKTKLIKQHSQVTTTRLQSYA